MFSVSAVIKTICSQFLEASSEALSFISQHVHFLESKTTPIILSSPFPLIPRVIYSQAERAVKVQPGGAPTVCGWSEEPGGGAALSPHSGSFLSSPSSSHTFLVARGELGWAWSGRYIPAANARPLITVIEETRQLSWQSWRGGWMPCHSHSF